ncbi:hypothetical protein COU14_00880 [Candidatus Kaiserbacteria bacterium CG10_big_fil_rev_8_21_14_0_10_44_10]|uniref:Uncharacterized protein n=1 Tax=Candidatus Kaiserbacteria bacterium CG10_big_fil_rev_8_21_14_0_10_44_10 TaxID=1974606 RepID=A0A2H0UI43_9BACT|nr:MAG: hypothetical protein COU14_00880 [Candidatus Kaiserbacteria bacterium CG10_big_fil_rev_8_21_14_0_10_44_10]
MKKVINITIGSVVFAIEQEAYDILASYLEQVKSNIVSSDDVQEIIEDVERAVAEKFIAQKKNEKVAVTLGDVELVISEMGSPADFGESDNVGESVGGTSNTEHTSDEPKKRLYRDTDNAIIAGVASGLARYFDIDPVIVRLIFVVSIFFNGLGILAYIILWLVVPVATTTAEKYAMRGERVTLKDITERVKKNIQSIEETDFETANGIWKNLRNILDKLFQVLGTVVKFIIVLARYAVGIVFIVGGALGIAGMVSGYSVVLLSDKILFPEEVQIVLETIQGSALGAIVIASSFIALSIPLVVLILAGASLLAKRNFFTVQKTVALAVVWIVAVVVAGTTSALQIEQVVHKINSIEGQSDVNSIEIERGFNDSSFKSNWKMK